MERHVALVGNRFLVLEKPWSCLARFIRSAASSRSWIVKALSKPTWTEYSRKRRAPLPWNVPAQVRASVVTPALSPKAFREIRSTRFVISAAARRENVISRMRRGSAPLTIRWATRCARVLVLPDPAPAITRSGSPDVQSGSVTPCSTARRCSELRPSRWADATDRLESSLYEVKDHECLGCSQRPLAADGLYFDCCPAPLDRFHQFAFGER